MRPKIDGTLQTAEFPVFCAFHPVLLVFDWPRGHITTETICFIPKLKTGRECQQCYASQAFWCSQISIRTIISFYLHLLFQPGLFCPSDLQLCIMLVSKPLS
ncbi:hypothetical protein CRM22_004289 [Opisthorchis felineus]|uniref:Uncharacterized protein n=1 Tax=Opisthorchis felineus TaxID=147828 RepID=A0A4S2LWY2_OPIFE|nr:hypothetical protein CRM22_004289 [Opisthorchis felineus]